MRYLDIEPRLDIEKAKRPELAWFETCTNLNIQPGPDFRSHFNWSHQQNFCDTGEVTFSLHKVQQARSESDSKCVCMSNNSTDDANGWKF